MTPWREPTLDEIVALARRYEVSKEAMARRVIELTDHTSAVVFSQGGLLRSFMATPAFPKLDVRNGQPLPQGSAAKRHAWCEDTFWDWEEIQPEVWLTGDCRRRGGLFEQCFDLADGRRVTLLSFEDEA